MSDKKIYTLTQLNQAFEKHVMDNFSQRDFWITAELIKINIKSGHHYLELADSINDTATARSRAVIWASTFQAIIKAIGIKELQAILQPGNKILFNVKIEFHSLYGLSLRIRAIDPTYSYGEIERKKQEVISRLKKEEIYDNQKKIHLPVILKRIALIGSPDTSGFRDFQNELLHNHDYNRFIIQIFPVSVQGENAAEGIVKAIEEANCYDVEVIVILRGGGSKMDLALFDDYRIAKAICFSKLPVLTGIGHETDEVVADLVARASFITPTAVARHLHYGIKSFQEIMRELQNKVSRISFEILAQSREDFMHNSNYLLYYSKELINYWRTIFQEQGFEISSKSRGVLFQGRNEFSTISLQLSSFFQQMIKQEEYALENILETIGGKAISTLDREREIQINPMQSSVQLYSKQIIDRERIIFKNQEELLTLLNPLKILASGYTISTIHEKDLKDVVAKEGEMMKTLAINYLIESKILKIKKINNEDR